MIVDLIRRRRRWTVEVYQPMYGGGTMSNVHHPDDLIGAVVIAARAMSADARNEGYNL